MGHPLVDSRPNDTRSVSITSGNPFRQPPAGASSLACLPENSHAKVRFPLVLEGTRGSSMAVGIRRLHTIIFGMLFVLLGASSGAATPAPPTGNTIPSSPPTEHVILFVLEGFGQDSLKGGAMPTLSRLIKEGAVTWSATAVKPALRLPTMASLITGMPVEKHGINWNAFEFSRGYPRSPSMFDY